ncbi:MAG: sulfatase-like hydrolase/transferase [Planctomycetaceae bacterium]
MRPELACYGRQRIHSPNINRLAEGGVLFERAYCMVPTCGASRASLMTGVRPSRNRLSIILPGLNGMHPASQRSTPSSERTATGTATQSERTLFGSQNTRTTKGNRPPECSTITNTIPARIPT